MDILKRVGGVLSASINELLDGIEDPEKMINQIIRDMDAAILEVRSQAAEAAGAAAMASGRVARMQERVAVQTAAARQAVEAGNDDAARAALVKKHELLRALPALEAEVAASERIAAELKSELGALEEKVQEARLKRETVLSRKRLREARERARRQAEGAGYPAPVVNAEDIIAGFDALAHLEDMPQQGDSPTTDAAAPEDAAAAAPEEAAAAAPIETLSEVEAELAELKDEKPE
jgi:phage shock protein A